MSSSPSLFLDLNLLVSSVVKPHSFRRIS
ncbi:hypothetical protein NP493_2169g00000 [Ridgeia piscesae]|uniref:Uncharacterized protein n=1 Tax=Ridgeia piscesae TaxID=27915 RepID=A0AAD9N2Q7_RIDPI|nr:hypothetical protein NP493_2169g00000 [Ridgeia piscesae]